MSITIDNITLTDEQEQSKKKKGFFRPKLGEKFFSVFTNQNGLYVSETSFEYGFHDFKLLSEGNCFKTEQEAEQHKTYLEALQRVRLYIMENHYFEPDYSDRTQDKYNFSYNYDVTTLLLHHSKLLLLLPSLESEKACKDITKNCEEDLNIIFNV